MRKLFVVFVLMLIIFIGLTGFILNRAAVLINYKIIWKSDWNRNVAIAELFYENQAKIGSFPMDDKKNIEKLVLASIIDTEIIKMNIGEVLSADNPEQLVEEKIKAVLEANKNIENLKRGVKVLYDIELDEFKGKILLPRAYEELLLESFGGDRNKALEWLNNRKKEQKIFIPLRRFYWDEGDGEIENKF